MKTNAIYEVLKYTPGVGESFDFAQSENPLLEDLEIGLSTLKTLTS